MATSSKDQFKYLISQNKGPSLEKVIEQILASDILNTAEFLEEKNIKDLKGKGDNKHYNTLYLFSFQTFEEYKKQKNIYIPLTPVMLDKLKIITLVELSKFHKLFDYLTLKDKLELKENFDVEKIIFGAISKGMITGKIDAKNEKVFIISVKPRGNLEKIESVEDTINQWIKNIDDADKYINEEIKKLNESSKKYQKLIDDTKEKTK